MIWMMEVCVAMGKRCFGNAERTVLLCGAGPCLEMFYYRGLGARPGGGRGMSGYFWEGSVLADGFFLQEKGAANWWLPRFK